MVDICTLSPKDFSLEVHGLPENLGDGHFLSFMDGHLNDDEIKVFPNDEYDTFNEKDVIKLNKNYNMKIQQENYLHNDKHEGIKLAITVKKLDNSIYK